MENVYSSPHKGTPYNDLTSHFLIKAVPAFNRLNRAALSLMKIGTKES